MATKKNSTLKNILLAGAIGIGGLAIYGALKGGNAIPTTSAEALTSGNSLIPSVWNRVQLVKDNKALAREYTNATMDLMNTQSGGLLDVLKNFPLFPLVDLMIYSKAEEGVRNGTLKPDAKDDDSRAESGQETTPNPTPNPLDKINLVYTNPGKETATGLGVRYSGGASSVLQNFPLSSNPMFKKVIARFQDAEVLAAATMQGQLIPATEDLKQLVTTGSTKSGSTSRAAALASMAKRTLATSKT